MSLTVPYRTQPFGVKQHNSSVFALILDDRRRITAQIRPFVLGIVFSHATEDQISSLAIEGLICLSSADNHKFVQRATVGIGFFGRGDGCLSVGQTARPTSRDHIAVLAYRDNIRSRDTTAQQQRCSAHNRNSHISVPLGDHWWCSSSSVAERGGRLPSS